METKIALVIPARLASHRFPGKVLHRFENTPMIEHVRRRACMVKGISGVYIATCDHAVREEIELRGGNVIMTSDKHINGTNRAAEAIDSIDCTHVVLVQGDEPLILPNHIQILVDSIYDQPEGGIWNIVSPVHNPDELDNPSIVKCLLNKDGHMMLCFRKSPCISPIDSQMKIVKKICGIYGFDRTSLKKIARLEPMEYAKRESIEQMLVIESGMKILARELSYTYPGVNLHEDAAVVESIFQKDRSQMALLNTYN